MATYPFELLKQALGWLRSLLPLSDAATGPLATGMLDVVSLPAEVLGRAFNGVLAATQAGWRRIQSLGVSAADAVAAPFYGIAEGASRAWSRITTSATATWADLQSVALRAGTWLRAPFEGLASMASSAFAGAGRSAETLWQALAGDISVLEGLRAIGRAVVDFLATPFRQVRGVIDGVWGVLRTQFSAVGRYFQSAAGAMVRAFAALPLVRTLREVFSAVGSFLSGDPTFFEAGRRILVALGDGIQAAATYSFELFKQALGRLRALLPFSDAATGPLSSLSASGAAILTTLAQGMTDALEWPGVVLARVFAGLQATAAQGWRDLQSLGTSAAVAAAAPFQGIAEAASEAWSRVASTATATWKGLQSSAQQAAGWISTPFEGMAAAALSAGNAVSQVSTGLWRTLAGAAAVLDSLRGIGSAVTELLATPVQRAQDMIDGVWSVLRTRFSTVGRFLDPAAASLIVAFRGLPLARTLGDVFSAAGEFLAGDTTFFEAGRHILVTLGQGIAAATAVPFELFKRALSRLRSLLPFSDAQTGPLSNLTASGAAILRTLAQGMTGVLAVPGTVLGRAFDGVLKAVRTGWQAVRSLSASAVNAVAAPFPGLADAASSAWSRITSTAVGAWSGLRSMAQRAGQSMKAPFAGLATAASSAWNQGRTAASGAWEAVESRVAGLARTAAQSANAVRANAAGGSTLLERIAGGIAEAATAPGRALSSALSWMNEGMRQVAAPAMLSGTLALTPVIAKQVPQSAAPHLRTESTVSVTPSVASPEASRRLGETRGALAPGGAASGEPAGENVRSMLVALLGKLDALADRPIDVSVTTLLDGRQVAQSVYRDIRERKIKNYETL